MLSLPDVRRLLFYSDSISYEDNWPNSEFEKYLQAEGNLGNRMKRAFEHALCKSDKALIIGSDCPYLNSSIIMSGFEALNNHDLVIGPTFDGGYYMLGMTDDNSFLFNDIPWSTPEVYPLTLDKIHRQNRSYWEGPKLSDIDHAEDWYDYQQGTR